MMTQPWKQGHTEEEDQEGTSSESSEESDGEAFGNVQDHHMWQHRYAKPFVPVAADSQPTRATQEAPETLKQACERIQSYETEHGPQEIQELDETPTKLARDSVINPAMLGPRGNFQYPPQSSQGGHQARGLSTGRGQRSTHEPQTHSSLPKETGNVPSERTVDFSESRSMAKGHVPITLTNMKSVRDTGHNEEAKVYGGRPKVQQGGRKEPVASRTLYADILTGKQDDDMKTKAKRTLKAIGKALAAGHKFDDDDEEDEGEDDHGDTLEGYTHGHSPPRQQGNSSLATMTL